MSNTAKQSVANQSVANRSVEPHGVASQSTAKPIVANRVVVKIGGAQIETDAGRTALARSVAAARARGHELILVHGGGNQIRALSQRLGLVDRYHEGLRITDAATADVVLMVLAGLVNKQLVQALQQGGVPACGLCGADGNTFTALPHRVPGAELGFVGVVDRVDATLIETLLGKGVTPVLATVAAHAADPHFYNLNADTCAGPLARAFGARALLFLTDVPGVLDAHKQLLPQLTPTECARLRTAGVIAGGMIPKVEAALAALREHPHALIKIAPASGNDAIDAALENASGTRFTPESAASESTAPESAAPERATPERATPKSATTKDAS